MTALKIHWQRMVDRIDALSFRERSMIFIAATAVLLSVANSLLIDPLLTKQKALSAQIVQTQLTTSALRSQIQTLLKISNTDPNIALRLKLNGLLAQSESSGKTLGDIQSRLVSPQQMPALLEDLLKQNKNVHLLALKTLPVETLDASTGDKSAPKTTTPSKPDTAGNPLIYKHGVEITLSGNYFDLLHYLNAIEMLPWRMFWGKVDLSVDDDTHMIQLTLRLYTLSQDQAWLST
ncbi:MAG: hypothetical protein M0Z83_00380 [Betaproteobacteria bacterium]|nr:hypothetical protein [Betaproteobacteria bacterium]